MQNRKFRGKEISTGKWVYGGFVQIEDECRIVARHQNVLDFNHIVEPESVGQFTGFKDSEQKDIYEGDILSASYVPTQFKLTTDDKCEIIFYRGGFQLAVLPRKIRIYPIGYWDGVELEIIGNVHESAEAERREG